jgi:signal transduction histidine kinase
MFASLRARLWLSYVLVVLTALSVVAIFVVVYLVQNPLVYRQSFDKLRKAQVAILQKERIQQILTADSRIYKFAKDQAIRILFYSNQNVLLFDTQMGTAPALPFPGKRLVRRTIPYVRDSNGTIWLYSGEKLADGSYLMVATQRPRVSILNVFADDILPSILWGGLAGMVLSMVAAFAISGSVANPLQKIVSSTRNLPNVEVNPLTPEGPQEVQSLTRAFNSMVRRVQNSQKSQREFVANVSHELKTPLTSIQGFSQAILDGTATSNEELTQAAQVIHAESTRMHRLVLDLLDLAKLDGGIADLTMVPVDMSELLRAAREKFLPQAKTAGVEILLDVPPDLPRILADGDRMAQVFTNLIDNAVKFTPPRGRISVQAIPSAHTLIVRVADTGIGIPEEVQSRIFDRFYQSDSARGGGEGHGTGLGLSIAKEIVLAHGGKITVRSQPGEGTCFEVALPIGQNSRNSSTART